MTLTADVRRVGVPNKASRGGVDEQGNVASFYPFPPAARVEIDGEENGTCMAYLYDVQDRSAGDFWFENILQAKGWAKLEFDIEEADWRARSENETPIFPALVKQHFAYLVSGYGFSIVQEGDWGVQFATDACIVTVSAPGVRLESREREIIRRRWAELLTLIQRDVPEVQLPPLSAGDPRTATRDVDGSQDRWLSVLALLLKQHGDKMLRGDFSGQQPIAG